MANEKWQIVRVPCTDGVERVGIDMEWAESLIIEANVTYEQATYKCLEHAEKLKMPVFNGTEEYDVDWRKVEY